MSASLSEATMSRLFDKALDSGKLRIHSRTISNWVTELTAKDGIADFVLTPTSLSGPRLDWAIRLASSITTPAAASVVAALDPRRLTSVEDIARKSDLAPRTVRGILARLASCGVTWGNPSGGVRLLRPIRESDIELWAYELKLKDWRHGMYQALQYRAFAHSVAIVLPKEASRLIMRRLGQFRAYNVGVLIFDPQAGSLRVLVRPKRSAPGSLSHYLFALSRFVRATTSPSSIPLPRIR